MQSRPPAQTTAPARGLASGSWRTRALKAILKGLVLVVSAGLMALVACVAWYGYAMGFNPIIVLGPALALAALLCLLWMVVR